MKNADFSGLTLFSDFLQSFSKNLLTKARWFDIISKSEISDAGMAQSVEHVIGNDEVISSILITSSRKGGCNRGRPFSLSNTARSKKRENRCVPVLPFLYPNSASRSAASDSVCASASAGGSCAVFVGSVSGCICSPIACATFCRLRRMG